MEFELAELAKGLTW